MSLLAHGGTAGLAVELSVIVFVAVLAISAWVMARSGRSEDSHDDDE
jgi:hypothetical protein